MNGKDVLLILLAGILIGVGIWGLRSRQSVQSLNQELEHLTREVQKSDQARDSLQLLNVSLADSLVKQKQAQAAMETELAQLEHEKDSVAEILQTLSTTEVVNLFDEMTGEDWELSQITQDGVVTPEDRIREAVNQIESGRYFKEMYILQKEISNLLSGQVRTYESMYKNCQKELEHSEHSIDLYHQRLLSQTVIHKREIEQTEKECLLWKIGLGILVAAALLL